MATGDNSDILARIRRLLPHRWWSYAAPNRDAIIGGLTDLASWCYDWIAFARTQSRIASSIGPFLDLIAFDFLGRHLRRRSASDDVLRARIKATILQERVTRAGMAHAIEMVVGTTPTIFEPWNTADTGGYDVGGCGYDTAGGLGSMDLPAQVFMTVNRPGAGVPDVAGYDTSAAGYEQGPIEYIGDASALSGLTDADVYDLILTTKPTGVTCWVALT